MTHRVNLFVLTCAFEAGFHQPTCFPSYPVPRAADLALVPRGKASQPRSPVAVLGGERGQVFLVCFLMPLPPAFHPSSAPTSATSAGAPDVHTPGGCTHAVSSTPTAASSVPLGWPCVGAEWRQRPGEAAKCVEEPRKRGRGPASFWAADPQDGKASPMYPHPARPWPPQGWLRRGRQQPWVQLSLLPGT